MSKEGNSNPEEEILVEQEENLIMGDSVEDMVMLGSSEEEGLSISQGATVNNPIDLSSYQYDADEITKAIKRLILSEQRRIFKNELDQDPTTRSQISSYDHNDEEFLKFLKDQNNRVILNDIMNKPDVKKALEKVEIEGYSKVHETFKQSTGRPNGFRRMDWDNQVVAASTEQNVTHERTQIVKDSTGKEIATLTETNYRGPGGNYRTIDFPKELKDADTMHLSLAAQDTDGKNIGKPGVFFTAHYQGGKLQEVSSPQPILFKGEGNDAVGYIKVNGKDYTLPVTRAKYDEMMIEVEKNKGQGVNIAQVQELSKDNIIAQSKEEQGHSLSQQNESVQQQGKNDLKYEEALAHILKRQQEQKHRRGQDDILIRTFNKLENPQGLIHGVLQSDNMTKEEKQQMLDTLLKQEDLKPPVKAFLNGAQNYLKEGGELPIFQPQGQEQAHNVSPKTQTYEETLSPLNFIAAEQGKVTIDNSKEEFIKDLVNNSLTEGQKHATFKNKDTLENYQGMSDLIGGAIAKLSGRANTPDKDQELSDLSLKNESLQQQQSQQQKALQSDLIDGAIAELSGANTPDRDTKLREYSSEEFIKTKEKEEFVHKLLKSELLPDQKLKSLNNIVAGFNEYAQEKDKDLKMFLDDKGEINKLPLEQKEKLKQSAIIQQEENENINTFLEGAQEYLANGSVGDLPILKKRQGDGPEPSLQERQEEGPDLINFDEDNIPSLKTQEAGIKRDNPYNLLSEQQGVVGEELVAESQEVHKNKKEKENLEKTSKKNVTEIDEELLVNKSSAPPSKSSLGTLSSISSFEQLYSSLSTKSGQSLEEKIKGNLEYGAEDIGYNKKEVNMVKTQAQSFDDLASVKSGIIDDKKVKNIEARTGQTKQNFKEIADAIRQNLLKKSEQFAATNKATGVQKSAPQPQTKKQDSIRSI